MRHHDRLLFALGTVIAVLIVIICGIIADAVLTGHERPAAKGDLLLWPDHMREGGR